MPSQQGLWHKDFHLHVNVSVHQLSLPTFVDEVKATLTITRLAVRHLTLEITESNIVDNDPVILANMKAIRALGIGIAIDDFGTGYSSLAYLHKLPFNCLKIDRAFVSKMTPDNLDASIVSAIITMTKGLNITVVSEGIETQEQAALLNTLGCQQAQGYLYGRPCPIQSWEETYIIPPSDNGPFILTDE